MPTERLRALAPDYSSCVPTSFVAPLRKSKSYHNEVAPKGEVEGKKQDEQIVKGKEEEKAKPRGDSKTVATAENAKPEIAKDVPGDSSLNEMLIGKGNQQSL